jgi:hypothetical protein
VNNKLLLYRAINKPAYNSTIEYDINRLVISFDNSQLSIDIKKDDLKMITIVACLDHFGFE